MATSDLTLEIPTKRDNENLVQTSSDQTDTSLLPHHVEFTADATEPGSPPTYDEAVDPSGLPPPSYDSLFGRVREVHKESSGTFDFLKNVIILLAGTIGCTIMLGVTIVIPVSMVVIGSVYFSDCPLSYKIPLYLIVGGSCGVLKYVFHLVKRCCKCINRCSEESQEKSSTFQNGMGCFMVAWFLLGSFWIYKEFQPEYYDRDNERYCNRTVYLFAFWQITSVYIILVLMSLCLCSVSLAVIAFAKKHVQISSPT